jgi:type IX secretion system PorP/SprF family membrane protein
MKNALFLFILLAIGVRSTAQQLNTSSFYQLYSVLHNPASAGSNEHAIIGGSFRKQWSNMPGSPQTGLVYGQTYLKRAKIGLGGYLYNDVTGPTSRTGLQMAYAYRIPVKEKTFLSLGLEARLQQLRFDKAKLLAELGGIDPVALGTTNRLKADAGFGICYNSPSFQLGASVSQLVQTKYNLYEGGDTVSGQSRLYRHYYLHGNYNWQMDDETLIVPNVLFIYLPNAPLESQFGATVKNKVVWFGLNWRAKQSWMISAGVTLKERFSIGYAFDIYSTPVNIYAKGSSGHELLLHYEFR